MSWGPSQISSRLIDETQLMRNEVGRIRTDGSISCLWVRLA